MKNLLIAYLFIVTNIFAIPPTFFNGEQQTNTYLQNIKVPNYQTTPLGGINRRLESGNTNELQNPSFEHGTITTGWTISNATSSGSSSAIDGVKAISLALTGALSLSQSSTINAAQKSGAQMVASIWVNSSDVSDLQLCSLKNGAEDKCTSVGGYVQGIGWRQLIVSFTGNSTSNGLKLKSTDTTGTVLVDQGFVGIAPPLVDFMVDNVYSARISSSGAVSQENVDWINGNASVGATSQYTLTFNSGIFTAAPNCTVTAEVSNPTIVGQESTAATSSTGTWYFLRTDNAAATATAFKIICQKQAADYRSSKAYVASGSVISSTTVYSARVTSAGTVSGENTDWINGNCSQSSGSFTCPLVSGIFTVVPNCAVSIDGQDSRYSTLNPATTTSDVFVRTSDGGTNTSLGFSLICQKQGVDYTDALNPVIVGSFQDVPTMDGTGSVKLYHLNVGGSCSGTSGFLSDCTSGTCAICSSNGLPSGVTVTYVSTGTYRINGVDGTKTTCTGVGSAGATNVTIVYPSNNASNTTYFQYSMLNNSGAAANSRNMVLSCATRR